MPTRRIYHIDVVSARGYAKILTSKRLQTLLLPEGILRSPYEILDYRVVLAIEDRRGMRATFHRTQTIRFLQPGVSAILDHAWGSGVVATAYHTDAGQLEDSFLDAGKQHLVLRLARQMAAGDTLTFSVDRTTMAAFVLDHQWWMETTIDHPILRLRVGVRYPAGRHPRWAVVNHLGEQRSLPVRVRPDGNAAVEFDTKAPLPHVPYVILWRW
jgi:hypothetical protein